MIEDILKENFTTFKKDGIYGYLSDYGEQQLRSKDKGESSFKSF